MPGLAEIAGPEHILGRSAGPVVDQDRVTRPQPSGVPDVPGRDVRDPRRRRETEIRGDYHGAEERLPDGLRLPPVETLEGHADGERIVAPQGYDVPPMRTEQVVGVEIDELRDQAAVGRVRGSADHCEDAAHGFG